ncbi:MAG: hypothetical protein CMJ84_06870 [Planctomycetes bacterium]|jgi:hypothetical protein|nr:hypothetical protein [Planctomycetota bacterium]MDP6408194.1 hypothetical protein [Planctomycetota bacterium]
MTHDDSPNPAAAPDRSGGGGDPTERALAAHLPGLVLVDRDLSVDGRKVADFVGLIDDRPVLFLALEGDSERVLLRTSDAVDFARRHGQALGAHLRAVSVEGEGLPDVNPAPARTVLLSDTPFSASLLERLGGFGAPDLLVLQRRRLESSAGTSEFFVALDAHPGRELPRPLAEPSPLPAALDDEGAFIAGLPPALARTGQALVERIGRIDEGLECRPLPDAGGMPGGLEWLCEQAPLCRVTAVEGHLEAFLAGSDVPHSIRTRAGVDVFLDWLLAFHLERLGEPEGGAELADVELVPRAPGPILSPEEIEAFRD